MKNPSSVILLMLTVFAGASFAQKYSIEPMHFAAGTTLTFHLQTRLNPVQANEMDSLPRGTAIQVKLLAPVDSATEADGAAFRGEIAAPVASGSGVILHAGAEVSGVLALLRNRAHPGGFRYELLVTGVRDRDKSYDLTASLSPSVFEAASGPASGSRAAATRAAATQKATTAPPSE